MHTKETKSEWIRGKCIREINACIWMHVFEMEEIFTACGRKMLLLLLLVIQPYLSVVFQYLLLLHPYFHPPHH